MTVARKYKIKTRKKSKTVFHHKKKIFLKENIILMEIRERFSVIGLSLPSLLSRTLPVLTSVHPSLHLTGLCPSVRWKRGRGDAQQAAGPSACTGFM